MLRLLVAIFLIASLAASSGCSAGARGWMLAIVTAGAILALDLGWWAGGEPRYLSMAVNAVASST